MLRFAGVVVLSWLLAACSSSGGGNPVAQNRPPTVSAAGQQNVTVGATVNLNATASDPDGDTVTLTWTLASRPAGSTAAINANGAAASFTADVAGTYQVQVTASDNRGGTASATVQVVAAAAANQAPTAIPGGSQNVGFGATVTVTGNGTDPDSDPLTCTWSFVTRPAGSNSTIVNPTGPCPRTSTFFADTPGTFTLRLTVSDGRGGTATADISINATAANRAPAANAGADQAVTVGANVTLSGTGTDPDNDSLTCTWSFVARPAGSTAALAGPAGPCPRATSFVADVAGVFLVELLVSDGTLTARDTVRVTAASAGNRAPTLSVNAPLAVFLGATATITATTSDPDGDPVTVSMTLLDRPAQSTATLGGAGATRTITPDRIGGYVIDVTASDGKDTVSEAIAIFGNPMVAGNYNVALTVNFTPACNRQNETRNGTLPVQQPTASQVILDLPGANPDFTQPVTGTLRGEEFFYSGPIATTQGTVSGTISGTIRENGQMNLSFNIPVIFGCIITGSIVGAR